MPRRLSFDIRPNHRRPLEQGDTGSDAEAELAAYPPRGPAPPLGLSRAVHPRRDQRCCALDEQQMQLFGETSHPHPFEIMNRPHAVPHRSELFDTTKAEAATCSRLLTPQTPGSAGSKPAPRRDRPFDAVRGAAVASHESTHPPRARPGPPDAISMALRRRRGPPVTGNADDAHAASPARATPFTGKAGTARSGSRCPISLA
jgi:hypothetical protein